MTIMWASVASYSIHNWTATSATIILFKHTSSSIFEPCLIFPLLLGSTIMPMVCLNVANAMHDIIPPKKTKHVWILCSITGVALCILEAPKVVANHYNSRYKHYIHGLPNIPTTHPKHTLFSLGHCRVVHVGAQRCVLTFVFERLFYMG